MGVGAGLYMYVVVVQKFTFAISSPDEFLFLHAGCYSWRPTISVKALKASTTCGWYPDIKKKICTSHPQDEASNWPIYVHVESDCLTRLHWNQLIWFLKYNCRITITLYATKLHVCSLQIWHVYSDVHNVMSSVDSLLTKSNNSTVNNDVHIVCLHIWMTEATC